MDRTGGLRAAQDIAGHQPPQPLNLRLGREQRFAISVLDANNMSA